MANRTLLGRFPNGEYGLRISRPGHNVLDMGLAPKNLAFDSRWPKALKIVKKGTTTNRQTVSFPSLSEPPFVILAYKDAQGRYRTEGASADTNSFIAGVPMSGDVPVAYFVCSL